MDQASAFFHAGDLAQAIDSATAWIRSKPTDYSARWFLTELLCFDHELERADTQLNLLRKQSPKSTPVIALFQQLIRAEMARSEFYESGRVPEFFAEPDAATELALRAFVLLRDGDNEQVSKCLEESESARQPLSGSCKDGSRFDDFRDLDDMLAGVFEVCTPTGKYFWVPCHSVRSIEFHPPETPQDLLWRRVTMDVVDGPNGEAFLPARYHAPSDVSDPMKLARQTDWQDTGGIIRGVGQKTFLVGESDKGIMELSDLVFEPHSATTAEV